MIYLLSTIKENVRHNGKKSPDFEEDCLGGLPFLIDQKKSYLMEQWWKLCKIDVYIPFPFLYNKHRTQRKRKQKHYKSVI